MLLLSLCAVTLAGIGVIAVLSLGYVSLRPILIGAGLGAVLAVPVAWAITRKLTAEG